MEGRLIIEAPGNREGLMEMLVHDPNWLTLPLFGAHLVLSPQRDSTRIEVFGPDVLLDGVKEALAYDPRILELEEGHYKVLVFISDEIGVA